MASQLSNFKPHLLTKTKDPHLKSGDDNEFPDHACEVNVRYQVWCRMFDFPDQWENCLPATYGIPVTSIVIPKRPF